MQAAFTQDEKVGLVIILLAAFALGVAFAKIVL
jgi:hypothetical protein